RGHLRLDSRAAALKGGDTGPAVVPGQPEKSLMIKAVGYKDADLRMPPKTRLSDEQVADLTAWGRAGAVWPDERAVKPIGSGDAVRVRGRLNPGGGRRAGPAAPPAVADAGWARTPVDAFLLAKLEAAGLRPAPPADRAALLRRVTFDLTGLPPTPAEVE